MNLREYIPALRYGAKILPSEIVGQGVFTGGNVYWVKKSTDSDYASFYGEHYVNYADGTHSIYNTIQTAVNASVSDRHDIIYVCAGKWVEDVLVLEKDGLRIYGSGNGTGDNDTGTRIRPNDATTKYPFTTKIGTTLNAASFHILSRGVEVAGFYFDGGGGCAGVYLGGGLNGGTTALFNSDGDAVDDETASGAWIHNNFFRGGNEGKVGLYMNGSKFGCLVENNFFERCNAAGIQMDAGNASCECCVIRNNTFMGCVYGIDIYGEGNSALGCQINSNYFGDRTGYVQTMGIYNRAGSTGVLSVNDNHFGSVKSMVLTTTDWTSGNSAQHAGSATEGLNLFMEESAAGT